MTNFHRNNGKVHAKDYRRVELPGYPVRQDDKPVSEERVIRNARGVPVMHLTAESCELVARATGEFYLAPVVEPVAFLRDEEATYRDASVYGLAISGIGGQLAQASRNSREGTLAQLRVSSCLNDRNPREQELTAILRKYSAAFRVAAESLVETIANVNRALGRTRELSFLCRMVRE